VIDVQDLERVVQSMMTCAMTNTPPTPEQLGQWVSDLSAITMTIQPRGKGESEDGRPTRIDVTFQVSRAHIETSCCVPHALAPLFRSAWESMEMAFDRALWRLPHPPAGKHRARATH